MSVWHGQMLKDSINVLWVIFLNGWVDLAEIDFEFKVLDGLFSPLGFIFWMNGNFEIPKNHVFMAEKQVIINIQMNDNAFTLIHTHINRFIRDCWSWPKCEAVLLKCCCQCLASLCVPYLDQLSNHTLWVLALSLSPVTWQRYMAYNM